MADKRLVEVRDGVAEHIVFDDSEDRITLAWSGDVAPVLDHNKALQNDGTGGYSPSRELRRAASIPVEVQMKWLCEEGIDVMNPDHWPAVRRKLNSNEYLYLRTAPGRL